MRKKITLSFLLLMMVGIINAQNNAFEVVSKSDDSQTRIQLNSKVKVEQNRDNTGLIYDNGPLINSSSSGVGGADESVLQNTSLGLTTLGFGHQVLNNNWIADDFTISENGGWDFTSLAFYSYQTGSTTTSTMNDLRIIIYDGDPSLPTTNIVWGDETTNRLNSTTWSGIYRVEEATSGTASNRPIMLNTCNVNFHLDAGTYWMAWQTSGTLGSGPWAPPITINGEATSGNGMQSIGGLAAFSAAVDGGTSTSQGFPFLVYGTIVETVPVSNWAIFLSMLSLGLFVAFRFRF